MSLRKEPFTLAGGCHCEAIRYTVNVPASDERPKLAGRKLPTELPLILLDHCDTCRKASGTFLQCWLIVPQTWVSFKLKSAESAQPASESETAGRGEIEGSEYPLIDVLLGKPHVTAGTWVRHYSSSDHVNRTFCGRCGGNLTYYYSGENEDGIPTVDLTLGSLDKESLEIEGLQPDRHGWWEDRLGWVEELVTKGDEKVVTFKNPGGVDRRSKA